MLSRFISKPFNLRFLTLIPSKSHITNPKPQPPIPLYPPISNPTFTFISRHFSSNNDNKDPPTSTFDLWKLSSQNDDSIDSVFGEDTGTLEGFGEGGDDVKGSKVENNSWSMEKETENDVFKEADDAAAAGVAGGRVEGNDWAISEGNDAWNFVIEDKEEQVFDIREGESEMPGLVEDAVAMEKRREQEMELAKEEKALSDVLKGPDRAFGDLIAASGITDEMVDGLMLLKDLDGITGLDPLSVIEDQRYEKNTRRSSRAEIERQKQEEIANSRVRTVDTKGRAYGTGRRKCSIARVWIQPGEGQFVINDKQFDVYFPLLDHRAALLRPFSETKTLGLWDVSCTVKGGGVSGQVGAIRLGISRALQNWEPNLRPPLREAGFLTRDSRVVERKKPGKAKARKSFQWVKR